LGCLRLTYESEFAPTEKPVLKVLTTKKSGKKVRNSQDFGTTSYQAKNSAITASAKRYRYTGKERDSESGLYFYGARYYAPWLCRFLSVDPKAAQFPNQSSYNYCFNNPINLIDPDGMAPSGGDPPKGSATNPVVLDEVEITATRTYPSAVSTGATSAPRADNITPGTETPLQNNFKRAATSFAQYRNEKNGGESAKTKDDDHMTTAQLGYQWVMGTGKDSHTFTENSIMGRQMLATPEVQNAIQQTALKIGSTGATTAKTDIFRSAGKENKLLYPISFATDLQKNPARAFHGSFSGKLTATATAMPDGKNMQVSMTINLNDKMSAISATHVPFFGKYNESTIGYKNNPYGDKGQFRTININYTMKVSMTVPIMPQAGQAAPSTLTTPVFRH
jgi:RHS repeat-associated protein